MSPMRDSIVARSWLRLFTSDLTFRPRSCFRQFLPGLLLYGGQVFVHVLGSGEESKKSGGSTTREQEAEKKLHRRPWKEKASWFTSETVPIPIMEQPQDSSGDECIDGFRRCGNLRGRVFGQDTKGLPIAERREPYVSSCSPAERGSMRVRS